MFQDKIGQPPILPFIYLKIYIALKKSIDIRLDT